MFYTYLVDHNSIIFTYQLHETYIFISEKKEAIKKMEKQDESVPSKPTDINNVPNIQKSDSAIIVNFSIQFMIAFVSIIVLLFVRKKLLWLYSPNTKSKKSHPAYKSTNSILSWLVPMVTISDVNLIAIIGLDSFMMLQTFKMLYRILFTTAILSIPLYIYYFSGSSKNQQLFLRFSILNVNTKNSFFIPAAYVYIVSFLVFYLVYVYYKKFISLRQAYIRSPAILSPLSNLKKMSFTHENYTEEMNLSSKSVLMIRVPPFINSDADFRVFVEALGCGVIDQCVLINDTKTLERLTDERDMIVRDIEREVERMYRGIIKEIKIKSKTESDMKDLYSEIEELEYQIRTKKQSTTNKDERTKKKIQELLSKNSPSNEITELAKKILYSKNKYIKNYKKIDALTYKMNKLTVVQKKISEEIKRINDNPVEDKPQEEIIDMMNTNNYMYTRINLERDVPFFSLGQIIHIKENTHLFTLDLPTFTKTGFVTFTDIKSAQLLSQCLISSKVFTCKALPAPAPNDVIWENINRGEIVTYSMGQ
ncbi:hypothetical protein BDAP_002359 [Binucleata daphniae]